MSSLNLPAHIRALQTQDTKPQSVKVVEIPFAEDEDVKNLPSDQVLVKTRAVALNPTDWKHAIRDWGAPGFIVGCDGAGDVVAVGSDVKNVKVGDRVAGFTYGTHQKNNGAYAEYTRYKADVTLPLPAGMSYEEGAAFPIPHFTAVQALYMRMGLPQPSKASTKKENILIWGGATAVGWNAIQLAKASGFRVITTASPANHAALRSIGADVTINYRDSDAIAQVIAAASGSLPYGLDCVSENGTTASTIEIMGASNGRHLVTLLPVSEEDSKSASEKGIKVEFTLAYTVMGDEVLFAHAVHFDAMPEDRAAINKWTHEEAPALFEGWTQGKGSPRWKGPALRKMPGGLENIIEGFEYMRDGKTSNEKLVYTIA